MRWARMETPTYDSSIHDERSASLDYVRYATLALAATRVDADELPGSIAEVGVFRGRTARFIRRVAPDRHLFLFDTFTGFSREVVESEGLEGTVGPRAFLRTSEEVARTNVGDDQVTIVRGEFPATAGTVSAERFALVHVDVDLESVTAAALEFFYPRVVAGGYIVIHDYNNSQFRFGCRRAVDAFFVNKPEFIIEIPDRQGSVVVRKSASP